MTMFDPTVLYGRCAICGGALTNPHVCSPKFFEDAPVAITPSKLSAAVRLYAAAMNLEGKALAQAWDCSESTVSRFLSGKHWPDGPTIGRILSWLLS